MPEFLTMRLPSDEQLLSAAGRVALQHGHLDFMLKMTIKTLLNLERQEAIDGLAYVGSRELRQRVGRLARKRFGDGDTFIKLSAIIQRASLLTEKRNKLVHGLWVSDLDGAPYIEAEGGEREPLPSPDELNSLAEQIGQLAGELNHARLKGFLHLALNAPVERAPHGP